MLNEGHKKHYFKSISCSVVNYGSDSDFVTSYISGSGSTTPPNAKLTTLLFGPDLLPRYSATIT
jgi:hypothetical protein